MVIVPTCLLYCEINVVPELMLMYCSQAKQMKACALYSWCRVVEMKGRSWSIQIILQTPQPP